VRGQDTLKHHTPQQQKFPTLAAVPVPAPVLTPPRFIHVHSWRKKTSSYCNHQHRSRAGKPELPERSNLQTAPPFVSIRVHSWFTPTPSPPRDSSMFIRGDNHTAAAATISTDLGLESPSYLNAAICSPPLHSCPFVSIRVHSCPFVSIRVHSCPFVVHPHPFTRIPK
jgi:hypothetical protein